MQNDNIISGELTANIIRHDDDDQEYYGAYMEKLFIYFVRESWREVYPKPGREVYHLTNGAPVLCLSAFWLYDLFLSAQ